MILRQDLVDIEGANASRHLMWTALGIVVACVVLFVLRDHRSLRRLTYTAMIVGLVLVVLPLIPGLGQEVNGAQIWVRIGGFSLQPAEFAKIAFAVFFAGYLVTNRDTLALAGKKFLGLQLPRLRDLGPDPDRLGRVARGPRLRARPRDVAPVLRPVRRACCTSPPSA